MISIKNLCKSYGENIIFYNFNLDIFDGEVLAVLGESGSGKTTLLNVLAGLTEFSGEVLGIEKPISMVFQKDMLVKNLTVKENLLLVNKDIDVDKVLSEVGLTNKKNEYIKNLSGGMARRVAIARALMLDAKTLFLDEPFINLDLSLKFSLMDKIKEKRQDKTIVLVTHDIKEAVYLADRIVIVSKGKIVLESKNQTEDKEQMEKQLFESMLKL
ncbi:MAG: ABC transporter ATP-binding protein [Clostridia bacterium]|nr:ABC transporter ATP-binding protein [Clostridia bacterium]